MSWYFGLGRVNATQCIDDQREDDESEIHDIKLVEAREDSAKALESPEQALRPRGAAGTVSGRIPRG